MADKGTLEAIEKLKALRPRRLLDMVDGPIAAMQNFTTAREGLVFGLRFLVEDFRRQAELVMDSGARGKGAEATALRSTASALSLLADAVEKVDLDGPAEVLPVASRGGPKWPAEWCGDQEEHGIHRWQKPGAGLAADAWRDCMGHHPRDTSGLTALVSERAGVQVISVPPGAMRNGTNVIPLSTPIEGPAVVAFEFADPGGVALPITVQAGDRITTVRRDGEMEAWLSGATNVMPPVEHHGEPQQLAAPVTSIPGRSDDARREARRAAERDGSLFTPEQSDAFVTPRVNTPENREEAAAMFVDPTPVVTTDPVMPGRRMSWADLRQPPTLPAPEHLSFSQGGTLDECGTRYRLERLEPEVVQRPKWATVGGTAVHMAVEWFELQALKAPEPQRAEYARSRLEIAGGVGAIWKDYFSRAMMEQVMRTPTVPPNDWKAGGRGQSEGWTWWQVEGEAMLQRYLDLRIAEMEAPERQILQLQDDRYAVELEGVLDVEGVPLKVVIDQVWRWDPGGDALLIDDLKSGAYAPKGTYQLALYAWYLRRILGYDVEIWGRYWDVRKGTFSEPVNLLEAHPWDEIVMRVQAQETKKTMGLFNPSPDWGNCGMCTVKHACPAALTRG